MTKIAPKVQDDWLLEAYVCVVLGVFLALTAGSWYFDFSRWPIELFAFIAGGVDLILIAAVLIRHFRGSKDLGVSPWH